MSVLVYLVVVFVVGFVAGALVYRNNAKLMEEKWKDAEKELNKAKAMLKKVK
jgi:uncharacterized membrane-anchored protein YhcB (DUF1043 family)